MGYKSMRLLKEDVLKFLLEDKNRILLDELYSQVYEYLLNKKQFFFLIFGLILICSNVFPDESWKYQTEFLISPLVSYPQNAKNENLVLQMEHVRIEPLRAAYMSSTFGMYAIVNEYTIKNTGDACTVSLGVVVSSFEEKEKQNMVPLNLQYLINSTKHEYRILENQTVILYDGKSHTQPMTYLVIDYTFPANSTTVVTVSYMNSISSIAWEPERMEYNSFPLFYDGFYSDSTPEYSIEIENSYINQENNYAEYFWISDIYLARKLQSSVESINMYYILMNQSSLNNDLFMINRTSPTTWLITFTRQFVEQYQRRFYILLQYWGGRYTFCYLNQNSHDLILSRLLSSPYDYLSSISQRKIGTYELIFLTNRQLAVMRNAFYAQYGYIFTSETMKKAFREDDEDGFIYRQNPDFSDNMLTDIDKANIETIRKLEQMVK